MEANLPNWHQWQTFFVGGRWTATWNRKLFPWVKYNVLQSKKQLITNNSANLQCLKIRYMKPIVLGLPTAILYRTNPCSSSSTFDASFAEWGSKCPLKIHYWVCRTPPLPTPATAQLTWRLQFARSTGFLSTVSDCLKSNAYNNRNQFNFIYNLNKCLSLIWQSRFPFQIVYVMRNCFDVTASSLQTHKRCFAGSCYKEFSNFVKMISGEGNNIM